MTRILAILFLLAAVNLPGATTKYVNPDAVGTGDGLTRANAIRTDTALNTAISSASAGDVFKFSGGASSKEYYDWQITVAVSGTAGNPITFQVDDDPSHNGRVRFTYPGDGAPNGQINVTGDYIVWDGRTGDDGWWFENNFNTLTKINGNIFRRASGAVKSGQEYYGLTFTNVGGMLRLEDNTDTHVQGLTGYQIRNESAITIWGGVNYHDNWIQDCYVELAKWGGVPPGGSGSYGGPDGFKLASGVTVTNCTIKSVLSPGVYTSTQHQDGLELSGDNVWIVNSEFINTGDAMITGGGALNSTLDNYYIVNCIFRIEDNTVTTFPEMIRFYAHASTPYNAFRNFNVMNCLFVDNPGYLGVRLNRWNNASCIFADINFINNVFVNVGDSSAERTLFIEYNSGQLGEVNLSTNVWYHPDNDAYILWGTNRTAAAHVALYGGSTALPEFVAYTPFGTNNDFRLATADQYAATNGVDLSAHFDFDFDGNTRSGSWSLGPYNAPGAADEEDPEFVTGPTYTKLSNTSFRVDLTTDESTTAIVDWDTDASGEPYANSTTPTGLSSSHSITVSGVASEALVYARVRIADAAENEIPSGETEVDLASTDPQISISVTSLEYVAATNTTAVLSVNVENVGGGTLTGTASVGGAPFSVTAGGSYSLANSQSQQVDVTFSPNSASPWEDTLTFTGGGGGTVSLKGLAYIVQPITGISAVAGTFDTGTTFFEITNNTIYQASEELDPSIAARGIFGFEITSAGDYTIKSIVNAADGGRNSFYLEDNEAPTSPADIWDIVNYTTGFEERSVSIRGSGTFDAPEFFPATFTLSTGLHYIDLRGREQEVYLSNFVVEAASPPPPAGASRRVNPRSGVRVRF